MDATGAVTDRYDYDAFGNIISQIGSTPNVYLYSGEQNDPNLGFYYLRARYLSQSTGRFWSMDNDEGDPDSPVSLHKYAYVGNEPVVRLDPSGKQFDVASISAEVADFDVPSSETTVHAGGLFKKTSAWRSTVSAYVLPEDWIQRAMSDWWNDPISSVCGLKKGLCATFVQNIWADYVMSIGQKSTLGQVPNWTFGASVEASYPFLQRGSIVATAVSGVYPSANRHAGFFLGYDSSGFYLLEQYAPDDILLHAPGHVSHKDFRPDITHTTLWNAYNEREEQ